MSSAATHAVVHVEARHAAAVDAREVAQVGHQLDDLLDAVQAVPGERVQVLHHVVGVDRRQALGQGAAGRFHGHGIPRLDGEQRSEAAGEALRLAQVRHAAARDGEAVLHVRERRVDLVGDSRDHLAQGGHLLRLHELRFRFLELLQGAREVARALGHAPLEILVGELQLALRGEHAPCEGAHAQQEGRRVGEEVDAPALLVVQGGAEMARQGGGGEVDARPQGEEGESPVRASLRVARGEKGAGRFLRAPRFGDQGGIGGGRGGGDARHVGFQALVHGIVALDVVAVGGVAYAREARGERFQPRCLRIRRANARGAGAQRGDRLIERAQRVPRTVVGAAQREERGLLVGDALAQHRQVRFHGGARGLAFQIAHDAREHRAVVERGKDGGGGTLGRQLIGKAQRAAVHAGVDVLQLAQQVERARSALDVAALGAHEEKQECRDEAERGRGEQDRLVLGGRRHRDNLRKAPAFRGASGQRPFSARGCMASVRRITRASSAHCRCKRRAATRRGRPRARARRPAARALRPGA